MGKPRDKVQRNGLGPDGRSKYDRKVKRSKEAGDAEEVAGVSLRLRPSSADRPGLTVSTAQAQPHTPRRGATERMHAVVSSKLINKYFMYLKSSDGEILFLSMNVLRKLQTGLLIGTKVECEVRPADPCKKYRRVVKVLHIVTSA